MTDNPQTDANSAAGYEEPNAEALIDYLQDMDDATTERMFILVASLDPFERNESGAYKYDQEQRDLIGETKAAYESAGYSLPE